MDDQQVKNLLNKLDTIATALDKLNMTLITRLELIEKALALKK